MIFRKAEHRDKEAIMDIIHQAQISLKEANIDQWQNQYPNLESIGNDIALGIGYVVEKEHEVVATVAYSFDGDDNYLHPVSGAWEINGGYAVIHRIAVQSQYQGRGISDFMMEEFVKLAQEKQVASIRVDTHKENKKMQSYLARHGFNRIGVIRLKDGALREAFEKKI
jgi:Acetyltransferases